MLRVALTGGIATGKSHVRARFEALGVPTIDADVLAREAVAPGSAGLTEVVRTFGSDVLAADGTLDRRGLGARVFADPSQRQALERIVHPYVQAAMDRWFAGLTQVHPFAIFDIPLLYETGRAGGFDAVIVTACTPEAQVQRIMARDGVSEADARARIAAQLPIDEKRTRADCVIDTNGSVADTDAQVDSLWKTLVGRWRSAARRL